MMNQETIKRLIANPCGAAQAKLNFIAHTLGLAKPSDDAQTVNQRLEQHFSEH